MPSYRGVFPLDRLKVGQFVRSAGDGTGACEVGNDADGWTRYEIGDEWPWCDSVYDDPEEARQELAEFGAQHFHHYCAREQPHKIHRCGQCGTELADEAVNA